MCYQPLKRVDMFTISPIKHGSNRILPALLSFSVKKIVIASSMLKTECSLAFDTHCSNDTLCFCCCCSAATCYRLCTPANHKSTRTRTHTLTRFYYYCNWGASLISPLLHEQQNHALEMWNPEKNFPNTHFPRPLPYFARICLITSAPIQAQQRLTIRPMEQETTPCAPTFFFPARTLNNATTTIHPVHRPDRKSVV